MKINILFAVFLVLSINLYSQSTKNKQPLPNNYFLQKSREQRDAGIVLLGLGVTAFITPIIFLQNSPDPSDVPGGVLISMGAGIVLTIASIPLFISAINNKNKGMEVSFRNETVPLFQNGNLLSKSIPSLSLKIGI